MLTHDIPILRVRPGRVVLLLCIVAMGCQRTSSPPPTRNVTLPHGMDEGIPGLLGFTDLEAALDSARAVNRPLFIYFTGFAVVSSRKMEETVLSSPEIRSILNQHFVVLYQYVDDRRPDPGAASDTTAKPRTIGAKCMEFERATFGKVSQPYIGFMDAVTGETVGGFGYETDKQKILSSLEKVEHYFTNKAH